MESLTGREKKIVTLLVDAGDYVSAQRIAETLDVSKKTVYRDLQSIKEKLGADAVEQCQGRGYLLRSGLFVPLPEKARETRFSGMSIAERRKHLLTLLLFESPKETSINRLAETYYVARASIVNDLASVETELVPYNLRLVRSHKGTYIAGKEEHIRKLLKKILGYELDALQENSHINQETYHYLFKEFSQKDIFFIEQLLREIEQHLEGSIKDPYYINIFTHLIILIKRLQNGIHSADCWTGGPSASNGNNGKAFAAARYAIEKISAHIAREIPAIEVYYIYQYLISSGIETAEDFFPETPELGCDDEHRVTERLIESLSQELGVDFAADGALRRSLLLHIRSLMKRVRYDIYICNPLLEEMKSEFSAIFTAVRHSLSAQDLFPQLKTLSEDELGYLAVYFQLSLEKRSLHKKVLIVCSSGVGTSHLLGARVKRAFPEWEIADIVSANRIGKIVNLEQFNFILTTVHLEKQKIPTILVSALFSELDILKVKNALRASKQ